MDNNNEDMDAMAVLLRQFETANRELKAAKARVDDLKRQIKALEKKKQNSKNSLSLQGTGLKLVVSWLSPDDVKASMLVCRQWAKDIDENLWRQIAVALSPEIVDIFETSGRTNFSYQRIALGLISKPASPRRTLTQQQYYWLPHPKLRLRDVVFTVEVKDKKTNQILLRFCRDFTKRPEGWDGELLEEKPSLLLPTKLEGSYKNHYQDDDDPQDYVPDAVFGSLLFTARLFRCDTGQSICFCFERECDYFRYDENDNCVETQYVTPRAKTVAGALARGLSSVRSYHDVCLYLGFIIDPVVPPNVNRDEPGWWKKTNFRLQFIWLSFMHGNSGTRIADTEFESDRDMLIYLEGLEWGPGPPPRGSF